MSAKIIEFRPIYEEKQRAETKQIFDTAIRNLILVISQLDTAPSEYVAPDHDPA